MTALVLYTLLSTAFWYLGSRATITYALWSRYPRSLARFMDCPACSGFWYGALWAITIGWRKFSFMGLASDAPTTPIIVGLCMITLVPMTAGLLQRGFDYAGSAIDAVPIEDANQTPE